MEFATVWQKSSQIASHLNNAPVKIHSLSLLTGSGRQHEYWLF